MSQRTYILLLLAARHRDRRRSRCSFAPPYDPKAEAGGDVRLPGLLHQRQPRAAGPATSSGREDYTATRA